MNVSFRPLKFSRSGIVLKPERDARALGYVKSGLRSPSRRRACSSIRAWSLRETYRASVRFARRSAATARWRLSFADSHSSRRRRTNCAMRRADTVVRIRASHLYAAIDRYVMAYVAFGPRGPEVAVAVSEDGLDWKRLGLLQFQGSNEPFADKDAAFFPEPVASPAGIESLAFYHRPTLQLSSDAKQALLAIEALPPSRA